MSQIQAFSKEVAENVVQLLSDEDLVDQLKNRINACVDIKSANKILNDNMQMLNNSIKNAIKKEVMKRYPQMKKIDKSDFKDIRIGDKLIKMKFDSCDLIQITHIVNIEYAYFRCKNYCLFSCHRDEGQLYIFDETLDDEMTPNNKPEHIFFLFGELYKITYKKLNIKNVRMMSNENECFNAAISPRW